ncbi:hypothetical protein EK904_010319 [Melospiza melodia maxima]|nr:hypothetical protein EK904_010319 [Melospiza melodia maxima]
MPSRQGHPPQKKEPMNVGPKQIAQNIPREDAQMFAGIQQLTLPELSHEPSASVSLLHKSFFTPYGRDESHPTRHKERHGVHHQQSQWGNTGKAQRMPAPSSSSPSHLSPCLTSPQSRLPQWSQKVGLM